MSKSSADIRHYGLTRLSEGETSDREIPEWAMGFRELSESNFALILGFTAFMNSSNQDDPVISQSERYSALLKMFRAVL